MGADIWPRMDLAPGLALAIGLGLAAAEDDDDFQGMFALGQQREMRAVPRVYDGRGRQVFFCRRRGSG